MSVFNNDPYKDCRDAFLTRDLDTGVAPDLYDLAEEFDVDVKIILSMAQEGKWGQKRLQQQRTHTKELAKQEDSEIRALTDDIVALRKRLFVSSLTVIEKLQMKLVDRLLLALEADDMAVKDMVSLLKLVTDSNLKMSTQIDEAVGKSKDGENDARKALGTIREKAEAMNVILKKQSANDLRKTKKDALKEWID